MDYRRIDELNAEAEFYVMELMMRFEDEMQGERKNYMNSPQEQEVTDASTGNGAGLQPLQSPEETL